jgi:hypothetical protein
MFYVSSYPILKTLLRFLVAAQIQRCRSLRRLLKSALDFTSAFPKLFCVVSGSFMLAEEQPKKVGKGQQIFRLPVIEFG